MTRTCSAIPVLFLGFAAAAEERDVSIVAAVQGSRDDILWSEYEQGRADSNGEAADGNCPSPETRR